MKKPYEVTYIMPANINEEEQKAVEDKVVNWINSAGGEIRNSSHWGRRRLAYPIGQTREGYYIFLEYDMEPGNIQELDRRMSIEPNVIRHLIVRADDI